MQDFCYVDSNLEKNNLNQCSQAQYGCRQVQGQKQLIQTEKLTIQI